MPLNSAHSTRSIARRLRRVLLGASAALLLVLLGAPAVLANVGLTRFEAKPQVNGILIEWDTQTELNITAFRLYRALSNAPADWGAPVHTTPAKGGITPAYYSFTDTTAKTGVRYYYLLEALPSVGSTERFGPVSAVAGLPYRVNLPVVYARSPAALGRPAGMGSLAGAPR